jgi:hypothetical protein
MMSFFQKNVIVSLKEVLDDQFVEDTSSDRCYALVTFILLSLLMINIVSVPMCPILLKFLRRRCGDFVHRESMWSVEFSSEDEDEVDDDFTTRTFGDENSSADFDDARKRIKSEHPAHWGCSTAASAVELSETKASFAKGDKGSRAERKATHHHQGQDSQKRESDMADSTYDW